MGFEVTATKKRPQTFEEISGQEFVVTTLSKSIKAGRIAHAYLFSGPRGVGKTSAARILAKAVNCEEGPTDKPCGKCSTCLEISKGSSLDVIEIDGASNTSVNDVREIKDEVLFAPNTSKYKVYIIDEVHMLSNSAFNALLKTIEEPPKYVIFIFATTEIHKVPATIRSRCQQFNFRLISIDSIKNNLLQLCKDNNISYEDDALLWISKEATGSLRDAYTLFDQVVSFSDNNIKLEFIREKLGLIGLEQMNELGELIASGERENLLEFIEEILSKGVSIEQFIIDLSEYFRNLLFLKAGITKESLLGVKPERFSTVLLNSLSRIQLEQAVDLLLKTYRNIKYSLNQKYDLELAILRLSELKSLISKEEILNKIETLKNNLVNNVSISQDISTTETAPIEKKKIDYKSIIEKLITSVGKSKLALASAMEKALRSELIDTDLVFTFDSAYSSSLLRQEMPLLNQKLKEITSDINSIIIKVDETKEKKPVSESDENVEMVKKIFRGDVVS